METIIQLARHLLIYAPEFSGSKIQDVIDQVNRDPQFWLHRFSRIVGRLPGVAYTTQTIVAPFLPNGPGLDYMITASQFLITKRPDYSNRTIQEMVNLISSNPEGILSQYNSLFRQTRDHIHAQIEKKISGPARDDDGADDFQTQTQDRSLIPFSKKGK